MKVPKHELQEYRNAVKAYEEYREHGDSSDFMLMAQLLDAVFMKARRLAEAVDHEEAKERDALPKRVPSGPMYEGKCKQCGETIRVRESEIIMSGSPPEFPVYGHCKCFVDMSKVEGGE